MTDHAPDVASWARTVQETVRLARGTETLAPIAARGRRLAAAVIAPEDLPAVAVSAMDGFALRLADLPSDPDAAMPVAADLPASRGTVTPPPHGAAVRIMTGAPVPPGCDTVIEVERTDADPHAAAPEAVRVLERTGLAAGRHVRAPGEEVPCGSVLAEPGDHVTPGLIALATTLGIGELEVEAPLRVGIVVTGDELVDHDDARGAAETGAVRESNGTMLAAALADLGAQARVLRSGDDPQAFLAVLDEAAHTSDLVITSGGIGHGAYDVVKAALGPVGRGTSEFAHVRLRPGGPQGVGRVVNDSGAHAGDRDVPVIHLPGTPVGALVGFHLFVRPLLAPALAPLRATIRRAPEAPRATGRRRGAHAATRVAPGRRCVADDGALAVDLLAGSRLAPYGRADCLVLLEGEVAGEGDEVRILPL